MATMWDFICKMRRLVESLPSREKFGEIMHDDSIPERDKQAVLHNVMQAGGYDNLLYENEKVDYDD